MFEIKEIAKKKLEMARGAQSEWRYLLERVQLVEKDYVILFPGDDQECNYYGMLYLDTFLQRVEGGKAVILTNNEYVKENIKNYSLHVKDIIYYSPEQIKRLITWFELEQFDPRLKIISLDVPFCRNARGIIGVKGTTIEQLIAIGVYSIIPFQPIKAEFTE